MDAWKYTACFFLSIQGLLMLKHLMAGTAALLTLSFAPLASAHTIAYNWFNYGWGIGFQPLHVHHSHGIGHTHTHQHNGGEPHSHKHGHALGAHHDVSSHALNVRMGPSMEHPIAHVLIKGQTVHINGCNSHNWCAVTYHGHHHGWVYAEYLD
jgi:uncharacterized protein YgiM (DUF1202 family)